ncbi:MAG: aminoglycoside phosphotransferase family protein [Chitinophagaceae bacterium]|nr:aminoglycoside phosphotransferase family protein [Chitinophagaceae bacterium]
MEDLQLVLKAYGIKEDIETIAPFGTGLINNTWKLIHKGNPFILQRINHLVFKDPGAIARNIKITGQYLQQHYPGYLFVKPVPTLTKEEMFSDANLGYFRLMPYVENSHTVDVVQTTDEAFEAAKAFGKLTRLLADFDCTQLKTTLPDFHNLSLRYFQFEKAVKEGNKERIDESGELIEFLQAHHSIVKEYVELQTNPQFKLRAAHHDTKISNVLFDHTNKAICVIDLDTLMPGYFISDTGDMFRTYISPVSEEETNFSKIEIRVDYFTAIVQGYWEEMNRELTDVEKDHFTYAGKFMIYMQALRFLTDHLTNDAYYAVKYKGHNYNRARNQVTLLQKFMEQEEQLQQIVKKISISHP